MSAYIVDNDTIDRIVTFFYMDHDLNAYLAKRKNIDLNDPETRAEFALNLYKMNVAAVDARYEEQNEINYEYRVNLQTGSKVAIYKSISCLLYQCAEGDVPKWNLYKLMNEIMHDIGDQIISKMPEYKNAKWA